MAVILAAGLGKRMQSSQAKVLHQVGGKPLLGHVVAAVRQAGIERIIVVAGHQYEKVQEVFGAEVEYVRQQQQLGTGHALMQAKPLLEAGDEQGTVVVLNGDVPLLTGRELASLLTTHFVSQVAATVLTAQLDNASGYGRIVRGESGQLLGIVEDKDATAAQLTIKEINVGVYCFRSGPLLSQLALLQRANEQGEYYLTDVIAHLREAGEPVGTVLSQDPQVALGVNDRTQLAAIACIMQQREVSRLMESGVTVVSPETTFVDCDVEVGRDTVIWPMTFLHSGSRIGETCVIGPNTTLKGVQVGEGCHISYSVIEDAQLGAGVRVGPFAHLRPGCHLEDGVRIGNFAEVKNSSVGAGSKIPHHSYVGDAFIGSRVNVGAGVVTVNYDGQHKHCTHIEDGAFVGCNANLLAPLRIGAGAYIAAGSTVGDDVPEAALAIAREPQVNKENWARGRKKR